MSLRSLNKKILLLGFLLTIGGIFLWQNHQAGEKYFNKIKSNFLKATVTPISLVFEESEPEVSEINLENSLPEERKTTLKPEIELPPSPAPSSDGAGLDSLTLVEIQEKLDDIAERVDEVSQEVTDLVGESQPALEIAGAVFQLANQG